MAYVDQVANSVGSAGNAQDARNGIDDPISLSSTDSDIGLLTNNRRSSLLNRVVEAEILPRLALARAGIVAKQSGKRTDQATAQNDTEKFVRLLIGRKDDGARIFIERLVSGGVTPASLYLGVITQAARRLGELWDEDRCDFSQVTISLGRLQQIVRALSPDFQAASVNQSALADTVLLLPAPGEQHTFGLVILAEFFRREGWHISGGPVSSSHDAAGLVRDVWVDVVGFSIGSIKHLDNLANCIRTVRRASRNRYIGVMVGGPLILQRPDLVTRIGADATAVDAQGAVRQARGLLSMRAAAD
jgi:methanogenic corrinoid protein MtbC1